MYLLIKNREEDKSYMKYVMIRRCEILELTQKNDTLIVWYYINRKLARKLLMVRYTGI